MIASRGAARRGKFDCRAVLKALFGVPLSSLPAYDLDAISGCASGPAADPYGN